MTKRWALFVSGSGTTAQAALDCLSHLEVKLVVSSRKNAFALVRARRAGIQTLVLDSKIDWQKLEQKLSEFRINQIFLLGFLKMVPEEICRKWKGRLWNIHPSLLPKHKGLHAIEKSYEENEVMGVSLHEVTPGMDEGPLFYQQRVLLKPQSVSFERAKILMAFSEQRLIRHFVGRSHLEEMKTRVA